MSYSMLSLGHNVLFLKNVGRALLPTHQTVLLPVVDPVPRASRPDDALELVGLHPYDLIHALVSDGAQGHNGYYFRV